MGLFPHTFPNSVYTTPISTYLRSKYIYIYTSYTQSSVRTILMFCHIIVNNCFSVKCSNYYLHYFVTYFLAKAAFSFHVEVQ